MGTDADGRSFRSRFCECSSSAACFRFCAFRGRSISSWEVLEGFWNASDGVELAAAVVEERNCRGLGFFGGEVGLRSLRIPTELFSSSCQCGRLGKGKGKANLSRVLPGSQDCVRGTYRVEERDDEAGSRSY